MANEEHLAILRQGVDAWNAWRQNVLNPAPDLSAANLEGANLEGAKLGRANLRGANLEGARLRFAILGGAYLDMKNPFRRTSETNLSRADLRNAYLGWASMYWANLEAADLAGADLRNAYLFGAKLYKTKLAGASLVAATLDLANVQEAQLNFAHLNGASLRWANLEGAILVETVFANVDLSATKGLETCDHRGPSILDHRTLQRSGRLPLAFLRGCGLSDWQIESTKLHDPGLTSEQITEILYRVHDLRATRPIQIHNLFISYSHADSVFLEHLEKHLVEQGIRFWRDIHDAPAGPLEEIVVRAIRHNPTVLLVLSDNSVSSDWVEYEAQTARELEKELGRYVLCPVALDKSWLTCKWSAVLRNQIKKYNVLDFSDWQNAPAFERKFRRLLSGIHLFYGDEGQQQKSG